MSILLYSLISLFIFISVVLIMIILIQKGRGGGLASAFGGGGGGNTAFGAKTGDVLTWVTSIVFGVFLLLAICLNLLGYSYQNKFTPRSNIAPVAPISSAPTPAPSETVPPLSTDSRPTNTLPTNPTPGQSAATPAVSTPAAPTTQR